MRYFMIYYIHKVRKNQKTRKELKFMSTKEMLEKILSNENVPEDVKEKAREVLASVNKRNNKRKEKQSEKKTADYERVKEIYAEMKPDTWYAVSEIIEKIIPDTELSKPKISALMKLGVENELFDERSDYKVNNKGDKKKGYCKIVKENEETDTEDTDTEDYSENVEEDSPFDPEDFED